MTTDERIDAIAIQSEKNERHLTQLAILMEQNMEQAEKDRRATKAGLDSLKDRVGELVNVAMSHERRIEHLEEGHE
jgi:hypothetical protein